MEIRIVDSPASYCTEVYLFGEDPQGNYYYTAGENGYLVRHIRDPLKPSPIPAFLKLPLAMSKDIIQAFIDYNDAQGIRSQTELKLEGELKATKAHLEDLQEAHSTLLQIAKKRI